MVSDIDAAAGDDPITGLRAVRSLRELADRLEVLQVNRARELGMPWQEIADALDVSRQAVHKKHGRRR
ncbi:MULTISPECIES: RNA polymerase subunit sigma-70 [unclassified Pseudactinotalea]|uniref:RNA polymerase subunit sigma-70 n=1 Tax=unclassified Pseudactinotalea TaxID=2649176 RepID=UPI00128B1019|nr:MULTISPECIES: RNA polymerase subunit sigma-70 [unclassified Pseudactinotalea]MPV48774.1 RNA polymerase subunit sigma-70 [Pseudactinotalea sp. HY160]QGH68761.1 RNA polymerase subunit sigma-70 [Pseudactinotalea sp. HY158]